MTDSGAPQHIGLFGGTFDPVHQGHLTLAHQVLARCPLDLLLFIPAPLPPHKRRPAASFTHRVAMLKAALADIPGPSPIQLSLVEAELPAPSYTIHTVEALRQQGGPQTYSLLIGADSLLDLPHWFRARDLLAQVHLIVVQREGVSWEAMDQVLQDLDSSTVWEPAAHRWTRGCGHTVTYLDEVAVPISSSAIRHDLAQGRIPALLPPPVRDYIQQHRLYCGGTIP